MKLIGRPKATVGLYSYGWMATEAEAALEMEDLLHSAITSGFGGRPDAMTSRRRPRLEATLEKEDLLNNFVSSESRSTAKVRSRSAPLLHLDLKTQAFILLMAVLVMV
jgi:hypothetical protein